MITCEDWRETPASVVGGLFDAECARWDGELGWDCRAASRLLELARQNGHLPGLVARDGRGRVVGWTYFLLHDRTLQIGNLVAGNAAAAAALLDGSLGARESRPALRARTFVFPDLPTIESALLDRGFDIEHYTYMQRRLSTAADRPRKATGSPPAPYFVDRWSRKLVPEVVRLLARAYEGMRQARCFAPDGRLEQWTTYVGQLVETPACGQFEHRVSSVIRASGELVGAVLATALGERTAHIAQMAVAPDHRGRGVGRHLVHLACERAGSGGFDRLTLLVAQSNDGARRLYERSGFEAVGEFLFADKDLVAGR